MTAGYIFIVGCNRTGTSLLRLILNRSGQICIAPETHFLRRLSVIGADRHLRRFAPLANDAHVEALAGFLYAEHRSWKAAYWEWLKRTVDRPAFVRRVLATDRSEHALFLLLMRLYAEATAAGAPGDLILGEKTPTHLYYVPTLLEWFPDAKIIHMFRDPRAITVSKIKKVHNKGQEGPKRKFAALPGWLLDPFVDSIEVLHMSRAWFDAARLHAAYAQTYPNNYRLLRFEDLIADPHGQVRQLCDFVGVAFQPDMLAEIDVVGSSYQPHHRGPEGFDRQTLDRWKSSINPFASAWFSILGRRQLEKFGYSV
jgi:hypothetical protein